MSLNKKVIKKRLHELEIVKKKLKKDFFGIDKIIDAFIDNIKIWYVMPEIQTRPLIVNLWGMTGVGKTDLMRKFVRHIKFNDRFIEIQMDISEGRDKIQNYLEGILDSPEEQGVLLLDEIQRFRTVNEDGREIQSNKFKDLWMLLSDGKFQSDSGNRKELFEMMIQDMYWDERNTIETEDERNTVETEDETPTTPSDGQSGNDVIEDKKLSEKKTKKIKKKKEYKFRMYYYEAKRLKKLLKLQENVEQIMTWDSAKRTKLIVDGLKSGKIYEGKSYSKLLIIISGNIDEAYSMSNSVGDADLDADIFHEFSKKIDMIAIKSALKHRFKPEQIARFGNIHLIYPSLDKKSYYKILRNRIKNILAFIKKEHGVEVKIDKSVYDVIYNNGVFPTQGVRPLLSTISSIFENSLPYFIFEALMKEDFPIRIYYENGKLKSKIKGEIIEHIIPRAIESIKEGKSIDTRAMVSVHEAGHAVAYAKLFGVAPTQVTSRTSNVNSDGFIGTHMRNYDKDIILKTIQVNLAGKAAEIMIFGENHQTSGCSGDIQVATQWAGNLIRRFGMNGSLGAVFTETKQDGAFKANVKISDNKVEDILGECFAEVQDLLTENKEFLKALSGKLMKVEKLEPEDFVSFSRKHDVILEVHDSKNEISTRFSEILEKQNN